MFQTRVPQRRHIATASKGEEHRPASCLHCCAEEAAHGAAEGAVIGFHSGKRRQRKYELPAKKD